ncbi:MAG: energy transducer TonB [Cyclobacteriaceae bacterium]
MKTLAITLLTILTFSTAALASDPNVAVSAKADNLSEVINSIEYPMVSRENGVEGRVVVLVRINEEGNVTSSEVISTPCNNLKAAVEDAITDLHFTPAKNAKGEAVATAIKIPIDFELTID